MANSLASRRLLSLLAAFGASVDSIEGHSWCEDFSGGLREELTVYDLQLSTLKIELERSAACGGLAEAGAVLAAARLAAAYHAIGMELFSAIAKWADSQVPARPGNSSSSASRAGRTDHLG
jgi:hypothetical protein